MLTEDMKKSALQKSENLSNLQQQTESEVLISLQQHTYICEVGVLTVVWLRSQCKTEVVWH